MSCNWERLESQGRLQGGSNAAGSEKAGPGCSWSTGSDQDGCCGAEPPGCDDPTICLGPGGTEKKSNMCALSLRLCSILEFNFAFTQLTVRLSITFFNISPKTWKLLVSLH